MALTANFLAELQNLNFRGNLVVSVDGTYFSQYLPDAGLVIDTNKIGLVDNAKINGVTLDIRRANTPIATISFDLLDKDAIVSSFMGASDNQLQGAEVILFFGFMTGSFDFSDYAKLGTTRLRSTTKEANGYKFRTKEVTDLIQTKLLNTSDNLDGPISDVATTLNLVDATNFPASGRLKIGTEFLQYSGKVLNQLTGVARGDLTSTAASHDDGDDVFFVTKKDAASMDIALDVLLNDLGIAPALIDQTSFTDLRDNEFNGEDNFVLYIYDIDNGLKWLEDSILESTNTRIFSVNGVITVGLLDQVPRFDALPEIDETNIQRTPSWRLSSDKLINKIIVKWAFNEGTQKYTKTTTFTDADSIAIFGERKALKPKFPGVFSASIVSNRATRLLGRFSTPKAQVKVRTHFNRFNINVADNVRLTHRFLPAQGGSLGFIDTLEVMSKSVSGLQSDSSITFGLEFSSYSGVRIGLIQPSPKLNLAITDQKTFTVPDGSCYGVGYFLTLWDNVNNIPFTDAPNEVASIVGNVLTMKDDFVTVLGSNVSLYFADYEKSSGNQRAEYAYTAPDTNIFSIDGSKAYQILF